MRALTFFIATSADGMIARENGKAELLLSSQDYGFDEFYAKVDTLLMGSKTFETQLGLGAWPHDNKKTYVFSKTLKDNFGSSIKVISRDAGAFVEDLKEESGGPIWLVGGAELARSLMAQDLVDEVMLSIRPKMLGTGLQLSLPLHSMFWQLKESRELPSGLLHVRYTLKSSDISFD